MKEVVGNLLNLFEEGWFDIIGHGCNCQNIMGAGIAYQIASKYPEVYEKDTALSKVLTPEEKLGRVSLVKTKYGLVANMYTQLNPGSEFTHTSLRRSMNMLKDLVQSANFDKKLRLGLPLIGCGIGGARWDLVKHTLLDYEDFFDITIVHYDITTKGMGEEQTDLFSET